MNDDNELDPVARLRAADPAGNVEPRAGFADEVVARAVGPAAEPATSAPVADLATERVRRRPRWIAIAAVAASVVIVGAAGYGLGASTGGTNLAGAAAPPISLQTGGSPGGTAEDGREPAIGGGAAPDERMDSTYPYGYGRNAFSASGLSTSDGVATAYAFDPSATVSAATVTALATALGIGSPAEQREGAWVVGPEDGSGPSLWVTLDGLLSFSYQNPQNNPWMCEKTGETCEETGEAPSDDVAIGALRALVVAAGRDPGAFEFSSHVWEDSPVRTAEARLVVDGQGIEQAWSMDIAESGVVSVNGALAALVDLGEYPVVSQQEGFERLSDPRFGAAMAIMPYATEPLVSEPDQPVSPVAPGTPPATPSAGTSISWPVNQVDIVSARLGLGSQWQPDGSVLVVPAYEFTDADGGTWSVIAVAESKLDFGSD
ncbi:MAG: hypothetical protein ABWX76_09525 [Leifsonia flava]